jgi:hypothetical protein
MWPYLWRAVLVLVGAVSFLSLPSVLLCIWIGASIFAIVPPCAVLLILLQARRIAWLWRFLRAVRRFRTATNGHIVLHYAAELDGKRELPALMQHLADELDLLTRWFSSPLPGRVVVFLFADRATIARIFGPYYGGTALSRANAIVIADDGWIQISTRHELAHLFSARWSERAPPLLSEGLSVWLEWAEDAQTVDAMAREPMHGPSQNLSQLLNPEFFFSEAYRHSCYLLAGSFCGFLIRGYGRERFEKLYKLCNGRRSEAKFKQCYDMTLEQAQSQWRSLTWSPGVLLVEESRTGVALTRARDGCGSARNIGVLIDDQMVGEVPCGCRFEFPLVPGKHSVSVKMDWCRSAAYEVMLRPGEMVELESCVRWRGFWALLSLPTALLSPTRAFVVRPASAPSAHWVLRELWDCLAIYLGVVVFLLSLSLLLRLVFWVMNP